LTAPLGAVRMTEGVVAVPILLPVASVCVSLILLAAVGTGIGLLSGLFGVGGGFLLTPFLMMTGVPATVAAASVSCQMVASSSSGVAAHFRLGNVDIKIGSLLLAGGLAGGWVGVETIKALRTAGEANLTITLTYIVVLGALGSYMFWQSLRTLRHGTIAKKSRSRPREKGLLARLPWQMDFPRSGVRHSVLLPLALAVLAGVLASVMGVGGGFIMLPLMIYLLGMPTHVAVGTSLFQILFLSAGVTFMQADANHTVDLLLVLPLAICSAMGAQFGVRLSRLLRGEQLMILLATLVLAVTGKMATNLFMKPSSLLAPVEISRRREERLPVETAAFCRIGTHFDVRRLGLSQRPGGHGEEAAGLFQAYRTPSATTGATWLSRAVASVRLAQAVTNVRNGNEHRLTGAEDSQWADEERRQLLGGNLLRYRLASYWVPIAAA
jgi:uncharacterized membrane protein YfcA